MSREIEQARAKASCAFTLIVLVCLVAIGLVVLLQTPAADRGQGYLMTLAVVAGVIVGPRVADLVLRHYR